MTVKELKLAIQNAPDDMDVMIEQRDDESPYNMANEANIENVTFGGDDIPRYKWTTVECFVIRD